MKIVIDFDDVLAETMRDGFLPNLNTYQRRVGGPFFEWKAEAFKNWGIAEATGFSEETIATLFEEVHYQGVAQADNAVKAVKDLWAQGHELVCLTANPDWLQISEWLKQHGLGDLDLKSEKNKVEWMITHDYSVIIDDNPQTLLEAANRGLIAFRFERPWNTWLEDWGDRPQEKSANSWYGVWRFFRSYTKTAHIATWEQIIRAPTSAPIDRTPPHPRIEIPFDSGEAIITNEKGAKQADLQARFDLLPALAIARVAQVLHHGAQKYGEENWRGLSVAECHNHTIGHAIGYNNSEDLEDLAHTACRALMTLELALTEWVKDG